MLTLLTSGPLGEPHSEPHLVFSINDGNRNKNPI